MARYSSKNEMTPAGTILPVGQSFSNSIKVESARDARIFLFVSAIGGVGALLDPTIQISPDNTNWADSGTFNQIVGIGNFSKSFEEKELSTYIRLKYDVAVDTITLKAEIEAKFGT